MNGESINLDKFNHSRERFAKRRQLTKSGNQPLVFNNEDIGLTIEPAFDDDDEEDDMHLQLMNINNRNRLGIPEANQVTLKPVPSKKKIKGQVNAARDNPRFQMRLDRAAKIR